MASSRAWWRSGPPVKTQNASSSVGRLSAASSTDAGLLERVERALEVMRAAGIADALQEPYVRALLESGEFPLLSDFVADGADLEIEDRFELGLDWLLDGFAAKIGR